MPTPKARSIGVATAVLAALVVHGAAWGQTRSIEYDVKAAYLYKFAPFVEWPPAAFASPSSTFQVCILGRDPFGSKLDRAVSGQRVADHPVAVRRIDRVDAASGCHILFLGVSRSQTTAEALRAVHGAPILTVADDGGAPGAIIRFVLKDNRVRFDIDMAAATANRVTISSKLLSLATSVKPGAGVS